MQLVTKFYKIKSCSKIQPIKKEKFPKLCNPLQYLFYIRNINLLFNKRRYYYYNKYSF